MTAKQKKLLENFRREIRMRLREGHKLYRLEDQNPSHFQLYYHDNPVLEIRKSELGDLLSALNN